MQRVSPRHFREFIYFTPTTIVECWIIEVLWYRDWLEGLGTCTLCGGRLKGQPWATIRYRPVDTKTVNADRKSISERVLRVCQRCGEKFSEMPFPREPHKLRLEQLLERQMARHA
jgi:hypothetical protein